MKPKIEKINYGIAYCNTDNDNKWIEVHEKLHIYPELYEIVIKHELEHYNTEGLWPNLLIDLKDVIKIRKQMMIFGFALRYPRVMFTNLCPIFIKQKKFSVNWFNTFYIIIIVLLFSLILYKLFGGV